MAERWKRIPGFPQHDASTEGRIRRRKGTKAGEPVIMRLRPNDKGYLYVTLRHKGKKRNMRVNRLIMLTFRGESPLDVNHKDKDRANNRLDNLEYMTHKENMDHALASLDNYRGESNPNAKLTYDTARFIRALAELGHSAVKIAPLVRVSVHRVRDVIAGRAWAESPAEVR